MLARCGLPSDLHDRSAWTTDELQLHKSVRGHDWRDGIDKT